MADMVPYDPSMPGCDTCGCEVAAPPACDSGFCGPGVLHRVGDRLRSVNCSSGCGECTGTSKLMNPESAIRVVLMVDTLVVRTVADVQVDWQGCASCGDFDTSRQIVRVAGRQQQVIAKVANHRT